MRRKNREKREAPDHPSTHLSILLLNLTLRNLFALPQGRLPGVERDGGAVPGHFSLGRRRIALETSRRPPAPESRDERPPPKLDTTARA